MKKIVKLCFFCLFCTIGIWGCSGKTPQFENKAMIDKKVLFSLTSLSVETPAENSLRGDSENAGILLSALRTRSIDSCYFTKNLKGFVRITINTVGIDTKKERIYPNYLWVFPRHTKYVESSVDYTVRVFSPKYEELSTLSQHISSRIATDQPDYMNQLLKKTTDEFQQSLYQLSVQKLQPYIIKPN